MPPLLVVGEQVETTDNYGQTPLHLAAMRGNLSVVEYFVLDADVQAGIKVHTQNTCTEGPPNSLRVQEPVSMCDQSDDMLRNVQDNNGCTALDLAIKKDQKQVAAFLQSSKADSTFTWRQMLSVTQWKQWFVGGGSVEVRPRLSERRLDSYVSLQEG
jgi:ankyrin repeat protein